MKQVTNLLIGLLMLLTTVAPLTGATEVMDAASEEEATVSQEFVNEAVQNSTMLLQLKQKLAQAQYRYYLLQSNAEQAKEGLEEISEVVANLEEEIEDLDLRVRDTEKQILNVKSQQERKKMDLSDLEEEIQILELQYEDQKKAVAELMRLIYLKKGIYYDASDEVNAVKVLAGSGSVSETLQQITYLDLIEEENREQIERMSDMKEDLSEKWDELREKRGHLDTLAEKLDAQLEQYEAELAAQEQLLEETQGQEAIYKTMIVAADESEESLLREIEIYQQNVELMEEKFDGSYALLTDEEQELIERIEEDMSKNFGTVDAAEFLDLDWPVSPSSGLTAYFIDAGYRNVFGVQHYALDVRAQQGTEIYAPADGVVNAVIYDEESTAYAFIRIAHRKGVMTVYGHVSDVEVQAGDYVTRGQLIGYTGGMPGSTGAGMRTTGPHLHMEVWQDGALVDPLKYLPLDEVPPMFLPEDYLKEIQEELEEQIFELGEVVGY